MYAVLLVRVFIITNYGPWYSYFAPTALLLCIN